MTKGLVQAMFCGKCSKAMLLVESREQSRRMEIYQCSNRPEVCTHRVIVVKSSLGE